MQTSLTGDRDIVTDDGRVWYRPGFLSPDEATGLMERLHAHPEWRPDEAHIGGRRIETKRKILWFGDRGYNYDYSGGDRTAKPWEADALHVRRRLRQAIGTRFDSCLLNLYHDGREGMGWHSDDQDHLVPDTPVAIVSLGTARRLRLRRTKAHDEKAEVLLEPGGLLVMEYPNQIHWQHEIPKMLRVHEPRISLTFRCMGDRVRALS